MTQLNMNGTPMVHEAWCKADHPMETCLERRPRTPVCTDFQPDYDGTQPIDGCLTCGKQWVAHPAECATCHEPCRYSVAYGTWMHFVTDAVTEGHRADPAPEDDR